jgi:sugar-phosphatase
MKSFACEALLFDLDGVLVDSTSVVVRAWREWAGRRGLDAERILEIAHGRRTAETIRLIAPDLDAEAETRALERAEAGNLDGVLEIAGALDLVSSLPEGSWTVVTSGTRELATARIKHVGLPLPERFVTADDVENGKPHPEPYLKGAEILGTRPEACVVLEDAPSGVQAAKAAGMAVVAVATTYRAEDLSEADAVAGSLAEVSVVRVSNPDGRPRFELRVR